MSSFGIGRCSPNCPRSCPMFYSLSGKMPYHQISWSLEALRLDCIMIVPTSKQCCCLFHYEVISGWFFSPTPLISNKPYFGLCQAACVQLYKRQPRSAVPIATCEVQVLVADSQTVPTVTTGVSKPLCCRYTITFTPTIEKHIFMSHSFILLVVIQLCSPRCWHRNSNYCRTRCRKSQLRFVLLLLLFHLRLLDIPVGYSTFHVDFDS